VRRRSGCSRYDLVCDNPAYRDWLDSNLRRDIVSMVIVRLTLLPRRQSRQWDEAMMSHVAEEITIEMAETFDIRYRDLRVSDSIGL
jgi:hypothetical protein